MNRGAQRQASPEVGVADPERVARSAGLLAGRAFQSEHRDILLVSRQGAKLLWKKIVSRRRTPIHPFVKFGLVLNRVI